MRLLIDAVAAAPGGAALTRVRELARDLPTLAPHHDYLFVVRPELEPHVRKFAPGAQITVRPSAARSLPARVAWEHLVLPVAARRFRPEVVFSPFNVAPTRWPHPRPRIAVMVSNLAPYAPAVLSRARVQERVRLRIVRSFTDRTVARADRVFLQSTQAISLIGQAGLEEKAEFVRHSPPAAVQRAEGSVDVPDEPYFMVVGDFYKFKGIEMVVRALIRLPASERPLVLLCGRPLEDDYVQAVLAEAGSGGVADRIRLMGPVDHAELIAMLSSARACIAPSRFENLSRVPSEAMAAGTPVIASDVPSFREACGEAALFFSLDQPDQLADHMTALKDDHLREAMIKRGQTRLAGAKRTDASAQILDALERLASG